MTFNFIVADGESTTTWSIRKLWLRKRHTVHKQFNDGPCVYQGTFPSHEDALRWVRIEHLGLKSLIVNPIVPPGTITEEKFNQIWGDHQKKLFVVPSDDDDQVGKATSFPRR